MIAPITPADRAAAEKALRDLWFECGKKPRDPNGGIDMVAQAIADSRAGERRTVAAYLVDRADQYVTDSASWIGLVDAAHALMDGEFETAVAHGELEDADLLKRVDTWAKGRAR